MGRPDRFELCNCDVITNPANPSRILTNLPKVIMDENSKVKSTIPLYLSSSVFTFFALFALHYMINVQFPYLLFALFISSCFYLVSNVCVNIFTYFRIDYQIEKTKLVAKTYYLFLFTGASVMFIVVFTFDEIGYFHGLFFTFLFVFPSGVVLFIVIRSYSEVVDEMKAKTKPFAKPVQKENDEHMK